MVVTTAQLERYRQVVGGTVDWAQSNWERIKSEKDLQGHYKAPYFWAAVGDMEMAGRHRKIIAERFLQTDGDFRSTPRRKGFFEFPCTVPNQYGYSNGWIISGMQKLGAYELVQKGLKFILRLQDPVTGGFYASFDVDKNEVNKNLLDSSSTSSAGMACLMSGRLEEAGRAGDFILRLFELQPEPDRYFFSCMNSDGVLHTDVFDSEDKWDPEGRKQKCLSVEADGLEELTWLIGKPTKFLARLYTATGEKRYLDAARWAFFFFHKLHQNAWLNYASCKTMWAGAELYRISKERVFAETALKILDFFCETQTESGTWVHSLWYRSEEEQTFCWTADITFEFGAEISDVICDLASV